MGRQETKRALRLVRRYIRQRGFTIKPLDAREWPNETFTNGGIIYKRKTVYLNVKIKDDLKKFYVLLHEAGHILAWESGFSNFPHSMSEKQAYLGGGLIALSLGIKLNWQQWRVFNWEAHFAHL